MKQTNRDKLYEGLDNFPDYKSDLFFIHSSILKIGNYDGGISQLLMDLIDYYGPKSTIGMPAFTFKRPPDNIWKPTAKTEMGALNNALLMHPDSHRSTHPTHSCVFIGPLAKELAAIQSRCVFGVDGLFEELLIKNAINIGLGTEFIGGATFLHLSERRALVSYRENIALPVLCEVERGEELRDGYTYFARKKKNEVEYEKNNWFELFYELIHRGVYTFKVLEGVVYSSMSMQEAIALFDILLRDDPSIVLQK